MEKSRIQEKVCQLLHLNGALTLKQIQDLCPEASDFHMNGLVADKAVHATYVLSENATAHYDEKAETKVLSLVEALEIIGEAMSNGARFRPFTDSDWEAFSGAEGNPVILECEAPDPIEAYAVIVDDNGLEIINHENDTIFIVGIENRMEKVSTPTKDVEPDRPEVRYFECIARLDTGNRPSWRFRELDDIDEELEDDENLVVLVYAEDHGDIVLEADEWWGPEGIFTMRVNFTDLEGALLMFAEASALQVDYERHQGKPSDKRGKLELHKL